MRAHLSAVLGSVVFVAACSSSEGPASATSSGASATSSAAKAASVALPGSAAAATSPSARAPAVEDADAVLKRLDPLADGPAGASALSSALALCRDGSLPSGALSGRDPGPIRVTRCNPATHAQFLLKSSSLQAGSTDAEKRKTAEQDAALALALDPTAALPAGASDAAVALFATAKKGPPRFGMRGSTPSARLGAVTTSDEATKKELEAAIAGEVGSAVRYCYTTGLFANPNLLGAIAIAADIDEGGRLSGATVTGDLPDGAVNDCVAALVNRSKVAPPSKAPAKVNIPFVLSPSSPSR